MEPETKRGRSAEASRRARIAVVGCGGWTQGWHLPNIANRTDAVLVALVDPSEQPGVGGCVPSICVPMSELCAKYGDVARYSSIEALLADKDALELHGVLCAAPHRTHGAIGAAVLAAGLHLLMEKPMTADIEEARALFASAKAHPEQAFLLNNTANWQSGTLAAHELVAAGKLGEVRHVNAVFASPLLWLFGGKGHSEWTQVQGSMLGNGFAWGQLSHTFAWIYKVTGLTPRTVYAVTSRAEETGADLVDAATITCVNGATISLSGVGSLPDHGFKLVANLVFGTKGTLSYGGLAGSDDVERKEASGSGTTGARDPNAPVGQGAAGAKRRQQLEVWYHDGQYEAGPRFEFEYLDQTTTGPGSLDAFVRACTGLPYTVGAGAVEGLKTVSTIEAIYRAAQEGGPVTAIGCDGL